MEDMPLPCMLQPSYYPPSQRVVNTSLATESRPGYGSERRAFSSTAGMGNGYNGKISLPRTSSRKPNLELVDRRDAYPPREQLPLPTEPPYTAHIGNMSFDTTEGEVSNFFQECQPTKVRIVEDKVDRKPKGFGYVEFATLDGLKKALSYAGSNLAGRTIKVSVADPRKQTECIHGIMTLTDHFNSEGTARWS